MCKTPSGCPVCEESLRPCICTDSLDLVTESGYWSQGYHAAITAGSDVGHNPSVLTLSVSLRQNQALFPLIRVSAYLSNRDSFGARLRRLSTHCEVQFSDRLGMEWGHVSEGY